MTFKTSQWLQFEFSSANERDKFKSAVAVLRSSFTYTIPRQFINHKNHSHPKQERQSIELDHRNINWTNHFRSIALNACMYALHSTRHQSVREGFSPSLHCQPFRRILIIHSYHLELTHVHKHIPKPIVEWVSHKQKPTLLPYPFTISSLSQVYCYYFAIYENGY